MHLLFIINLFNVTIETVGQAFLPYGSCQNMNLRKMVNRYIVQYPTQHNMHSHKIHYIFKAVL